MTLRTQLFLERIKDKFNSVFVVIRKFLKPKHPFLFWSSLVVVIAVLVGVFQFVEAESSNLTKVSEYIFSILNNFLYNIAYSIGVLVMKLFSLLIMICSYTDFVNNKVVTVGWVIIRDVFNMIIVILLLVNAIGIVLQQQKIGSMEKFKKLIVVAVLINFSKLICALAIDVAQVFMMTFVNGFAATAGSNLIAGLKLEQLMTFEQSNKSQPIDNSNITLMLVFIVIYAIIALIVAAILCVYLGMRVIILWICMILSPIAFLGGVIPFIESLAKKWNDYFYKWLITGPVVAFFLWISLYMMQDAANFNVNEAITAAKIADQMANEVGSGSAIQGVELMKTENLLIAFFGILMLIGSVGAAMSISGGAMEVARAAGAKMWKYGKYVPGAQAVGRRVMAVQEAWKIRRQEKESIKQAKAQAFAGKMFKAADWVTKYPKKFLRGSGGVIRGIGRTFFNIKSAKKIWKEVEADFPGASWWVKARKILGKTLVNNILRSAQIGWAEGGSIDKKLTRDLNIKAIQHQVEASKKKDLTDDERVMKIINTGVKDREKAIEIKILMEKGTYEEAMKKNGINKEAQSKYLQEMIKSFPEMQEIIDKKEKEKYAHVLYNNETIAEKIADGTLDVNNFSMSFWEDEKKRKIALSINQERSIKAMEKFLQKGLISERKKIKAILKNAIKDELFEIDNDGKILRDPNNLDEYKKASLKDIEKFQHNIKHRYVNLTQDIEDIFGWGTDKFDEQGFIDYLREISAENIVKLKKKIANVVKEEEKRAIALGINSKKIAALIDKEEEELANQITKIKVEGAKSDNSWINQDQREKLRNELKKMREQNKYAALEIPFFIP